MSFVVHENFGVHKYTRIHRADCYYVKPPGTHTANTYWHPWDGAYPTLDAATPAMDRQPLQLVCKPCKRAGRLPDEATERWIWQQ